MINNQTKRLAVIQQRMTHQTIGLEGISSPSLSHALFHTDATSTKVIFTSISPNNNRTQSHSHISCLPRPLEQETLTHDTLLKEDRLWIILSKCTDSVNQHKKTHNKIPKQNCQKINQIRQGSIRREKILRGAHGEVFSALIAGLEIHP